MLKFKKTFHYNVSLLLIVLLLAGCTSKINEVSEIDSLENEPFLGIEDDEGVNEEFNSTTVSDDSNGTSSEEIKKIEPNHTYENKEEHLLSPYSAEEIEYARVWLQLGSTKEYVDELNVRYISAGTPLNSDDETSAIFPENVIKLAGTRLVDGSVSYSGNGDGTINVYNVPVRWDGQYPAGEEFYQNMIENTVLVAVDPGDDEKIIEIIEKMKIH